MAIGSMHVEWLSMLALNAKIPKNAATLDLGPQDLWMQREPLTRVAQRHLPEAACKATLEEIFGDGHVPKANSQRAFYSIFGGGDYRSLDLTDPRADYAYDLNHPIPESAGKYDI